MGVYIIHYLYIYVYVYIMDFQDTFGVLHESSVLPNVFLLDIIPWLVKIQYNPPRPTTHTFK